MMTLFSRVADHAIAFSPNRLPGGRFAAVSVIVSTPPADVVATGPLTGTTLTSQVPAARLVKEKSPNTFVVAVANMVLLVVAAR